MSTNDPLRTGLWKKDSNNGGAPYYGGKIVISEPGEYWVNLYKNDRKDSDDKPDLNLQLKPKDGQQKPKAPVAAQSDPDDLIPF